MNKGKYPNLSFNRKLGVKGQSPYYEQRDHLIVNTAITIIKAYPNIKLEQAIPMIIEYLKLTGDWYLSKNVIAQVIQKKCNGWKSLKRDTLKIKQ